MKTEFGHFLKQAREDLCEIAQVYTVEEHRPLRTRIDSLLIAYDQAVAKALYVPVVSSSKLKSDLLADIKMSCDGTYSDAIDDWDLVDTAEDVINRINKTVDKHYR